MRSFGGSGSGASGTKGHMSSSRVNYNERVPTAERRAMEIYLSACPRVVNYDLVPVDFGTDVPRGPRKHGRRHGEAQPDNLGCSLDTEPSTGEVKPHLDDRPVPLLTTTQMNARLFDAGLQIRRETEAARKRRDKGSESVAASEDDAGGENPLMSLIGAPTKRQGGGKSGCAGDSFSRLHPTDKRSTYRMDYCFHDAPTFHDPSRHKPVPEYRKEWTVTESSDVDTARCLPYLTLPSSLLQYKPTIYRHDYLGKIPKEEFRTLSVKTNPFLLTTSYAYTAHGRNYSTALVDSRKGFGNSSSGRSLERSAYSNGGRPVEDEGGHREKSIRQRSGHPPLDALLAYDQELASMPEPHSLLEKSFSPRDSIQKALLAASTADEDLEKMHTARLNASQAAATRRKWKASSDAPSAASAAGSSLESRESSTAARSSTVESSAGGKCRGHVVLPGIKGTGYRRAPKGCDDYIYLPREHFCHQAVYDY